MKLRARWANAGADIPGCGPLLLGIHYPPEVTSKDDAGMCHKAFRVFFEAGLHAIIHSPFQVKGELAGHTVGDRRNPLHEMERDGTLQPFENNLSAFLNHDGSVEIISNRW
jgi:hypothetical protein